MTTRSPRSQLAARGAHREGLAEPDAGDGDRAARDRRRGSRPTRARPPSRSFASQRRWKIDAVVAGAAQRAVDLAGQLVLGDARAG